MAQEIIACPSGCAWEAVIGAKNRFGIKPCSTLSLYTISGYLSCVWGRAKSSTGEGVRGRTLWNCCWLGDQAVSCMRYLNIRLLLRYDYECISVHWREQYVRSTILLTFYSQLDLMDGRLALIWSPTPLNVEISECSVCSLNTPKIGAVASTRGKYHHIFFLIINWTTIHEP